MILGPKAFLIAHLFQKRTNQPLVKSAVVHWHYSVFDPGPLLPLLP